MTTDNILKIAKGISDNDRQIRINRNKGFRLPRFSEREDLLFGTRQPQLSPPKWGKPNIAPSVSPTMPSPVPPQVAPPQSEGLLKDFTDSLRWAGTGQIEKSKEYFLNAFPNLMASTGSYFGRTGKYTTFEKDLETKEQYKAKFNNYYQKAVAERQKWEQEHSELAPIYKEGALGSLTKDWNVIKDPTFWAEAVGQTLPYSIGLMAAGLASTTVTGSPIAGMLTTLGLSLPSITQEINEDLVANGATDEQAAVISAPAGLLAASIEAVGDQMIINRVSGALTKQLTKEVGKEIAREGFKTLLKKGITDFTVDWVGQVLEEVAQKATQNAAVWIVNQNRSLLEGIPEAAVGAAIASIPLSGFAPAINIIGGSTQQIKEGARQLATQEAGAIKLPGQGKNITPKTGTPAQNIEQKQPWQMTKSEFLNKEIDLLPREQQLSARTLQDKSIAATHEMTIRKALAENKPVPPEVLKDYPGLAKQPLVNKPLTTESAIKQGTSEPLITKTAQQVPPQAPGQATEAIEAQPSTMPQVEEKTQPVVPPKKTTQEVVPPAPPEQPPTTLKEPSPLPETPANKINRIHSELEADINLAKKKLADVKTPLPTQGADVQFARLALNDANKLIGQAETLTKRIEQGKQVAESEIDALNDKAQSLKDYYKYEAKTVEQAKQKLVDYISKQLPLSHQSELLTKVKNVKNDLDLTKAFARVNEIVENDTRKGLISQINQELSRTKPERSSTGILQGKYTADIQEKLTAVNHNLKLNRDDAMNSIAENIASYQRGEISNDELLARNELLSMAGVKEQSAAELSETLTKIQSLKATGKLARNATKDANDTRLASVRADVVDIVTGGKGLKAGLSSISKESLTIKKNVLERLVNAQYSWDNLLDKLSKLDKSSQPYQSKLSEFGKVAHEATMNEVAGVQQSASELEAGFKEVFGTENKSEINAILNKMQREKVDLGTFRNADGEEVTFDNLTKDQIIKKVMELQDPTLDATFEHGMKWTPKIKDAFVNSLSEEEMKWAQWQLDYYQKYYDAVNEIYRKVYGVDLPHNLSYSPISRELEADTAEDILLFKDLQRYAAVTNSGLKSRVSNIKSLKYKGATETLLNHVIQMEHFKGWAEPIRDLRAVFGNDNVRAGILQYHGQDILNQVDRYITDFTRGGVDKAQVVKLVDTIRTNFTRSVLGFKPVIALNQLPTTAAYMTEMPVGDFLSGIANFWVNPIKNYKQAMANSTYLKDRYTQGFERDIRDAMNKNLQTRLTGKTNVLDITFGLLNMGDRVAVVQGWWAKYQSELKAGKNETRAMLEADMATNRTQNTSSIESLSSIQRGGSWQKLFTMFQNQQNKYFRIIADNMRNFGAGRGSRWKAISNIALVWVVLPMIFQFIADGFQFKKERQGQAVVLGPINNLLIFGQIAESLAGWVTGENYDYQGSPVLGIMKDAQYAISNTLQFFKNMKTDDLIEAVEYFAKFAGELTGLPTPYLVQAEKGLRAGNPKELAWSRYALDEAQPKKPVVPLPPSLQPKSQPPKPLTLPTPSLKLPSGGLKIPHIGR